MKTATITVIGAVTPIEFDLNVCAKRSIIIATNTAHNNVKPDYAIITSELQLQDAMNQPNFKETRLLVPENMYKKYLFFENVDELPRFPVMKSIGLDEQQYSKQSLALMLACWMEPDTVHLFGYDIQDLIERERLLSIGMTNPHTHIVYTRKPNPNKIFLFNDYENISVMDYKQYQKENVGKK
jgi:hypothetical protein